MRILKTLIDKINNLDNKFKNIMTIGFKLSFVIGIIAIFTLLAYVNLYSFPNLFYAGISLLHTSLMFGCTFFICGIGFDTIKKQMI